MLKKIIKFFLIFIFFFFLRGNIFALELENIYYNSGDNRIDSLIDNGIINKNDNFSNKNLGEYLKRDEFLGILQEINCVNCNGDNISEDLKNKFLDNSSSFFDINKNNPNYFCIASAKESGITTGYTKGHICDDGSGEPGKIPFCPNNKIKLEEAIAMLFRSSKIFTINDVNKTIEDINSGKITKNLALDVKPKLANGQAYSFYGDIKKALNYSIEEYDEKGNKKVYHMLKVGDDGKIHPERYITRKEFFDLAYIIFKTNSCLDGVRMGEIENNGNYNLGTNIKIFDDNCIAGNISNCNISDLDPNKNIFDFYGEVGGVCEKGVKEYRWEFFNLDTKQREIKFGKFIDNYKFKQKGNYKILLRVLDNCSNIGVSEFEFYHNSGDNLEENNKNNLDLDIEVIPDSGEIPLDVSLKAKIKNKTGEFKYTWIIGGEKIQGEKINYLFSKPGKHKVKLVVEDNNGNRGEKEVYVNVGNSDKLGKIKVKIKTNSHFFTEKSYIDLVGEVLPENGNYKYYWYIGGDIIQTPNPTLTHYFSNSGNKTIKLKVIDENGKTGVGEISIFVKPKDGNNAGFNISIDANPLSGYVPLAVNFKAIVSDFGNSGDFDYSWKIGNELKVGKIIDYSFKKIGTYKVILKVKDKISQKTKESFVSINVKDKQERPGNDTDGDGIPDKDDNCKLIPGVKENNGCPTDSKKCNSDCSCSDETKKCNTNNLNICSKVGLCIPKNPEEDPKNPDTDGDGVPDKDDKCVFTPGETDNNGCPKNSYNCDSNCSCSDGKICNTNDSLVCSIIGVCIPGENGKIPENPGESGKKPAPDTDGDGVPDIDDDCVFVFGEKQNNGCPINAKKCDSNCSCQTGYKCNTQNKDICSKSGICVPNNKCNSDCSCPDGYKCSINGGGSCDLNGICIKQNSCLDNLSKGLGIFGNAICNTCPCNIEASFSDEIQVCDVLFPAILSPDGKKIYSKGGNFVVK